MPEAHRTAGGLTLLGPISPEHEAVLTAPALEFVAALVREFTARRDELLAARVRRQARFDAGERPDFLPETRTVREGAWTVAPLPLDLQDRRVEITGPVERKMVINALNSGARVFMADFEDANSPTWDNVVLGHRHLGDAVRGTIEYTAPDTGKQYRLGPRPATLMVRPRGLHLPENHVRLDSRPIPAFLFDFALYLFHNARALLERGGGPYFYLPKLQSHLEARLWNDVFLSAQRKLGLAPGTIKATVLIETLPAAFEMDEILHELREHSAGLNCGRWDYIFSVIKTLRGDPGWVIPDRAQVTMEQPFMRAYTQLAIRTCHRREVHAMGGMAAQIPIKDPERSRIALDKVRADKLREVRDGHDGTWVAHPGLVPVAREIFDAHMKTPNQIHLKREDVRVSAADLLQVPTGTRTEAGLRHNIRVGVQYLESWLRGSGCVPLYDLMEDAATAEISRTQVWQWVRHGAGLEDGRPLTAERFRRILDEELQGLRGELGPERYDAGRFAEARSLFDRMSTSADFNEFLTLPAYEELIALTGSLRGGRRQEAP
jgi:malate synthase